MWAFFISDLKERSELVNCGDPRGSIGWQVAAGDDDDHDDGDECDDEDDNGVPCSVQVSCVSVHQEEPCQPNPTKRG